MAIATVKHLYRVAFGLAVLTILCSGAEGLVSAYFGYEDQSLTFLDSAQTVLLKRFPGLALHI